MENLPIVATPSAEIVRVASSERLMAPEQPPVPLVPLGRSSPVRVKLNAWTVKRASITLLPARIAVPTAVLELSLIQKEIRSVSPAHKAKRDQQLG